MTQEEVGQKIVQIVEAKLKPGAPVTPKSSFVDDLQADSLDIVEVVVEIERVFSIKVAESDAQNIRTIQDAIDYVTARIN